MNISGKLKQLFASYSVEDKALNKALKNILGFEPSYLPYYIAAVTHRSYKKKEQLDNNERLEFLGDAFIGSIIGAYLFKKYPVQDEGFLTEMRSKIVSRQSLNAIAIRMGLQKLVRFNHHDKLLGRSHIFGNALEALVGAIYLDKGFNYTKKFILKNLLGNYVDIDELEQTEYNFKNKLYTWSQKNNLQLDFNTITETLQAGRKVFDVGIYINGYLEISATGYNKKEASQRAAEKALEEIIPIPNYPFTYLNHIDTVSDKDIITDTMNDTSAIHPQESNSPNLSLIGDSLNEDYQVKEIEPTIQDDLNNDAINVHENKNAPDNSSEA